MVNKKGDKYECEDCGLVVLVEAACGCESCEIFCCGEPMKPVAAKGAAKSEAKSKHKPKK